MTFCKHCNTETKYTRDSDFSRYHLATHNMTSKEYYDLYFKKDDDGKCFCGKTCRFLDFVRGYANSCGKVCARKNPKTKENISKSARTRDYTEANKKRKETVKEKYGVDHVMNIDEVKDKVKNVMIEKYGVDHSWKIPGNYEKVQKSYLSKINDINDKRRNSYWNNILKKDEAKLKRGKTNFDKYGIINTFSLEESKDKAIESRIERGLIMNPEDRTKLAQYRLKVLSETRKYIDKVKSSTNKCYYTGQELVVNEEYIKLNPGTDLSCNKLQPTIDHKISIKYGFLNNIDPKIIGGIDNLCLCARNINTIKGMKTEEEYLNDKV